MKKRLFSILLALTLCLSLLPMSAFAVSYSDIEGHWAEDAIVRWSDYGMIQGSNGQFRPYGTLTRAHMATMLARLLGLPEAKSAGFTDTAGHWAEDAIDRCAAAGILLGDEGKASPDAPITRQQAMTMLCRALQYRKDATAALNAFADADKVSGYAAGYLAALVNDGVVLGNKGKLDPLSYINRGQMVAIIDRMIDYYANGSGQTVSAENGGLVLVVAKDVSIVDAPAGTTVVVGKDAAGLKVNGVLIAAGQVYTVPAPGTAVPSSHDHTFATDWSFDDDSHWHAATCGHDVITAKAAHSFGEDGEDANCTVCGAFNTEVYVAAVNGTAYRTLAEAFAAVSSAAQNSTHTIEILKDIELSSWTAVSANYQNITINGNGHTITGLTDALIGRVGPAAISVKDLTFDGVNIEKTGTGHANQGYAALIGYCDFSGGGSVTVDNCHVTNSSFDVYQWAGAFVGATDIPQKTASITIKNSSVSNTSFKVEDGSCGAFVGYTCTGVTVENSQVLSNCTFECTEDRNGGTAKAGSVIGTISHGAFVLTNVTVADTVTVTNKNATPLVGGKIGRMLNNAKLTIDGVQCISTSAQLAAALTSNAENISIRLVADVTLPIAGLKGENGVNYTGGSGQYKLGGSNTKSINIDLGTHKLTLSTTYWSVLGAHNGSAVITVKNGSMNSTGNYANTWNAYDLTFYDCTWKFEDVTFDKAVAIATGTTADMKNVTINESNSSAAAYALWITAEGQTVTLDNVTIQSKGGQDTRAIAIKDQYVKSPQMVTLNISNSKISSAAKAAVLVTSTAGATINASNVDISGVTADSTNLVWVDNESGYQNLSDVTVIGCTAIVEPS